MMIGYNNNGKGKIYKLKEIGLNYFENYKINTDSVQYSKNLFNSLLFLDCYGEIKNVILLKDFMLKSIYIVPK